MGSIRARLASITRRLLATETDLVARPDSWSTNSLKDLIALIIGYEKLIRFVPQDQPFGIVVLDAVLDYSREFRPLGPFRPHE